MSDPKDKWVFHTRDFYTEQKPSFSYTQGSFTSCLELMMSLHTRLQEVFQERRGDEYTDFEFIFDSTTGLFLLEAVVEGVKVEEILEFDEVGHLHHRSKTFQSEGPEASLDNLSYEEDVVEDFYDFVKNAIEDLSDD